MNNLAPVIIFTFNRPKHTRLTLEALTKNNLATDTDVFVFCDGTRDSEDNKLVEETRDVIRKFNNNHFRSFSVIESEKNLGLANSIIQGVGKIIDKYEKVIVLEDDLITSPFFLEYMNDALNIYTNDQKVFHVSGYWYPITGNTPETFFLSHISSWGWGTWKRAWQHMITDSNKLIKLVQNNREVKDKMNLDNTFNFFSSLKANADGKIKTWAIKWKCVVLLNGGLSLFPHKSLIKNIGHDGTGTNSEKSNLFKDELSDVKIKVEKQTPIENIESWNLLKQFYKRLKPSIFKRMMKKILN